MLFFPHHANLDRLWMLWQRASAKLDPRMAHKDVLWGYPKKVSASPPFVINHTMLHDVMLPLMPFTDIFKKYNAAGATHYDLLTWKRDYTYDDLVL